MKGVPEVHARYMAGSAIQPEPYDARPAAELHRLTPGSGPRPGMII